MNNEKQHRKKVIINKIKTIEMKYFTSNDRSRFRDGRNLCGKCLQIIKSPDLSQN